jgi:lysophospholipase L1-like esterase
VSARPWRLRAALALGGTALTVLLLWAGLEGYARWLGLRDYQFIHEHELPVFQPDARLHYRTRPNLRLHCFGTIRLESNELGFRGSMLVARDKPTGVKRLIGLGDSVMWGIGVNEADTFLGKLGAHLAAQEPWEIINAGVIGYSTWQEAMQLERDLLALRPDVLVVNYCENDLFSTEDPFGSVTRFYTARFQSLLEGAEGPLPATEQANLVELLRIFSQPRVKTAFDTASAEVKDYAHELLIARPMRRMAALSKATGTRLVYVFIPPRDLAKWDNRRVRQWQDLLAGEGVEWLDVTALFSVPDPVRPYHSSNEGWKPPVRVAVLDAILLQKRIDEVQAGNLFLDHVHPTKRGNEIIAEELHRFLSGQVMAEGVKFHRRETRP